MIHRREFTVGGLSAAAISVLGLAGHAEERTPAIGSQNPADHFEPCARACSDCQRECDFCAAHCADMVGKGEQTYVVTLQACLDCANICAAAAHVVARHGIFSALVCRACADACSRCAKECETLGKGDQKMTVCADQCRMCEKSCREMVAHSPEARNP